MDGEQEVHVTGQSRGFVLGIIAACQTVRGSGLVLGDVVVVGPVQGNLA